MQRTVVLNFLHFSILHKEIVKMETYMNKTKL